MNNRINHNDYDKNIFQKTLLHLSRNKIGTEKLQPLFEKYDIDHNGTLDTINFETGANELEIIQKDYEKLIENNTNNIEEANNLKELFNNIINYIKNGNENGVYYNGKEIISNGKIDEEVHQSEDTGNCWLISRLNTLSDTDFGSKAIEDAIDKVSEDSYKLKLMNPDEEIIIPTDELQMAVDSGKYSDGDLDAIIIELGLEKSLDKALEEMYQEDRKAGNKIRISEILMNTPGKLEELPGLLEGGDDNPLALLVEERRDIIKRLTGLDEIKIPKNINSLEDILLEKSHFPKGITLVFDSKYDIEAGEKWDDENIHDYSIKKVTRTKNGEISKITVINPWNSKKEIVISYSEFKEVCNENIFLSAKDKNITDRIQNRKSEYELAEFKKAINTPQLSNQLNYIELPEDKIYKQRAINETGGFKAFIKKLDEISRKYFEFEENTYKTGGIDELLKLKGIKPEEATEAKRLAYKDYMNTPIEEKVKKYNIKLLNFYCSELGFSNQEIQEIINNQEEAEKYCKKYNYKY